MADFCQLKLTCANEAEALKISNALLGKKLVACIKQSHIRSDFLWQSKQETSDEILLEMTSRLDLFEKVNTQVKKLHSYDAFVLEATTITKLNQQAKKWLSEELARS